MRFSGAAAAALLAAALCFPGAAAAWSGSGHAAIAQIAQDLLGRAKDDPAARVALSNIKILLNTDSEDALAALAPCADRVRAEPPSPGDSGIGPGERVDCGGLALIANTESKNWHYVDIPVGAPLAPASTGALAAACPGGDCVVDAIRRNARVLGDSSASLADKRVALMYLVHFVGDEHQPLHCATEVVGGRGDGGGNAKKVRFDGVPLSLHSLWDRVLKAQDEPVDVAALEKLPSEPQWTRGDFIAAAALESFKISQNILYPSYRRAAARTRRTPRLDDRYAEEMRRIADTRLQMAGYRLAALLRQSLGGAPLGAR